MNNEIRKALEEKAGTDYKVLGKEDTFRFTCDQCGECCKNRNDILLTPYDIHRASKYLEITPAQFIKKYCRAYRGHESGLPLVIIEFKERGLRGEEYTVCPFRKKENGLYLCGIHPAKPFVCFSYPVGRATTQTKRDFKAEYFAMNVDCGISGEGAQEHTYGTWFGEYVNLEENEGVSVMYNAMIQQILNTIDFSALDSNRIPEPIRRTFLDSLFHQIYVDIDTSKPILEVMKTKQADVLKMTTFYVHLLESQGYRVKARGYKLNKDTLKEIKKQFSEAKSK